MAIALGASNINAQEIKRINLHPHVIVTEELYQKISDNNQKSIHEIFDFSQTTEHFQQYFKTDKRKPRKRIKIISESSVYKYGKKIIKSSLTSSAKRTIQGDFSLVLALGIGPSLIDLDKLQEDLFAQEEEYYLPEEIIFEQLQKLILPSFQDEYGQLKRINFAENKTIDRLEFERLILNRSQNYFESLDKNNAEVYLINFF